MRDLSEPASGAPGERKAVAGFIAAVLVVPAGALGAGIAQLVCWCAGVVWCFWSVAESRRASAPVRRLAVAGLVISAVIGVVMVAGVVLLLEGRMPYG
ncbi:hypothetical protein ACFVMC_30175 [Nocardia sp. NPDC127579]|uniref:hypothetical protein n=1 Tax=Nocardia sp. NPDC127579 TaxID=3345402 RepID=UPI003627DEA4